MDQPERPLLDDLKAEVGSLGTELRQMVALRWELARVEIEAALAQIKRLSLVLVAMAVMLLSSLPVLTVALAAAMASREGARLSLAGWLLILGLGMLTGGIAGGWMAWRRFRRRFTGIEQTLEELHEDARWLRQWTGRDEDANGQDAAGEDP